MKIQFSLEPMKLPLAYAWAISRSSTNEKVNYIVKVKIGDRLGLGEVAPNLRYGETAEKIQGDFEKFCTSYNEEKLSLEEFSTFLDKCQIAHALQFGLESAYLHALLKNKKVHEYFQLKGVEKVSTSFSIPIMEKGKLKSFLDKYKRFQSLKIKVNSESAFETISTIYSLSSTSLRIDGNEAWNDYDEFVKFMNKCSKFPIEFFEQPFPADRVDEYKELKKKSKVPIFADESITYQADFNLLKEQFHGVNVKLMKAGGYINAISQLKQAREQGLKTMLGCMIETSLGIFSALNLSSLADYIDLDGFLHLSQEPFALVCEKDGELFFNEKKS